TIGKRKAELAEEVLGDFYEARDIITAARSPGGFGHEGVARPKAEWETEDDRRTLNAYFRTMERLRNKEEFFARFHARRYRFMAHFGTESGQPGQSQAKMIFTKSTLGSSLRYECSSKHTNSVISAHCPTTARHGKHLSVGCLST